MTSRLSIAIVALTLVASCGEPIVEPSSTLYAVVVAMGASQSVGERENIQMIATAHFSDIDRDVTSLATWQSSNRDVATISSTGFLMEVAEGTTIITATYQGKTGAFQVGFGPGSWDYARSKPH